MSVQSEKPKVAPFLAVSAVYLGGINPELDERLIEAAGRDSDGSGCFLIGDRERDHSWYFEICERAEADKLAGRLRALPVRVDVVPIGATNGRVVG